MARGGDGAQLVAASAELRTPGTLRLARLFGLALLAPLAFALAYEAYHFMRSNITVQGEEWFLAGLGVYSALYVVILRERIRFLEVLEHELAHTVVSLAFFKVPRSLQVDHTGQGEVGPVRGDFLSCLAPYYLPVLTVPLLLIKPYTYDTVDKALSFMIGISVGFHYGALASWEFRLRQSDLREMGRIFSVIVIIVFSAVWLLIILYVVAESRANIMVYLKNVSARTLALYELILESLGAGEVPNLRDLIEQSAPALRG